ncbi:paraquat-inducible protein A [Aliidiomarina soli]|uniref:Paraquat-inducible protein A n=1 Tax=Aliidiomarina soli TaxID=1928574 RepID=A0A432WJI8_9GAMM|nr:paraquat-inducible protein A [Aliidiomarina soli]RUO33867.1 paraquat-inducible protein A [Aliidiomarina soli]
MKRRRACPECDLVVALPALKAGQAANCPRCKRELTYRAHAPAERVLAYALSALIMLAFTMPFSFMSFALGGQAQDIVLLDTATAFRSNDWPLLSILIAATVLVLPGLYLIAVVYVYSAVALRQYWMGAIWLARAISSIKPWLMTDVFLVGVLVSLVKLLGMADIQLGMSFWAFCGYVILLVKTVSNIDTDWMWFALRHEAKTPYVAKAGVDALSQGLVGCDSCGLLNRIEQGHCRRCFRKLRMPGRHRIEWCLALLLTASILYIPANLYPMMRTVTVGGTVDSTIIGGVWQMAEMGSYLVAAIIFFASIIIPIAKIAVLSWLCFVIRRPQPLSVERRVYWYRVVEFIGRWSMIDVFVVAIMVALIQAGALLSIYPGPAAMAFAAVVVLTMLAAMAFDPKALWHPERVRFDVQEWKHERHL